jgi:SNF2 family DNA or RNA helicase
VRTKRARLTCSESGLAELASSLQQLQVKPDETVAVTVCPLTQVRLASGRVVRQYQADIVFWTERVEGGLVCAEMGLGKTCVALLCLARYLDPSLKTDLGDPKARAASPCLVVASSEETIVEWTNELRYFPSLVWTQLDLDKPCPELGLVITTYDALATAMERIKADVKAELKAEQAEKKEPAFDADLFETLLRSTVFGVSFGLVIGDELQKVANKDTRWHQAMCRLQAQRKFGLSGTPLSNSVRDVRAQLKFCLGPKVVARLQDSQLKEYIFVLDCAQAGVAMPNKNVNLRRLELDPETRGLYKRVDGSGLRKIVRMGILRQVCIAASLASDVLHKYGLDAGLRAWLDDAKSSAGLGSPKMLVLAEQLHVVCVDQKEQLLVFSTSAKALSLGMHAVPSGVEAEMICDEVPKPERKQIVKRFKQGAVRVLFLTYKLGSEGLNFQNCCHELTLDDWWTDSSRSQAHARTFRSGQERDVSITRLQIRDSVDEHVAAVARRKGRAQAALLGKEVQL